MDRSLSAMPVSSLPAAAIRESHGFVRVAAVSPELVLGDPAANAKIILTEAQKLAREGCRVIVFPELCLTGYSCGDLFHTSTLREQALSALSTLAEELKAARPWSSSVCRC